MKKLIVFGFMLLMLISSAFAFPSVEEANVNLEVYYNGSVDSSTGNALESKDGNGHLQNAGNAAESSSCKVGTECFVFDGTGDYFGNSSNDMWTDTSPDNGFTVCAWVNGDTDPQNAGIVITDKGAWGESGGWPSNPAGIKYASGGGGVWQGHAQATQENSGTNTAASTWYHICVTGDGSAFKDYTNGALDCGGSCAGGVTKTSGSTGFFVGSTFGSSQFFDGIIDEVAVWNYTLNATNIAWLYNSGNGRALEFSAEPPPPPAATSYIIVGYNSTAEETDYTNVTINYGNFNLTTGTNATLTYNSLNYSAIQYYDNSMNVTYSVLLQTPLKEFNNTDFQFKWTGQLSYSNGSTAWNQTAIYNQSVMWKYYPTLLYASDSIETQSETVYMDFVNLSYANLQPQIQFLNLNYTALFLDTNTAYINVTYPLSNTKTYNYTGYLNVTFNGTSYLRTTFGNNTVYKIELTNCSTGYPSMSFYTNHEDDLYWINADTIDFDITFWNPFGNASYTQTFGYTAYNTYNATICFSPPFAQYQANAYIINTVSTGYAHRYYLVNANITNYTKTVNLYNFNSTDQNTLSVNIVDDFFNPIPDVVVKLLRYYPSGIHVNSSVDYSHSWQTVQVDKSDEFGETVFHVSKLGDTDYRFVLESQNTVIKETATMKLLCPDPANCEITFQVNLLNAPQAPSPFTGYNYTYNEANEMVTVTWDDTTLLTDKVEFIVAQEKLNGRIVICGQTFATASGTFNCNTSGYSGMISVNGYRTASPLIKFIDELVDKTVNAFSDALTSKGLTRSGAFWSAMLSMTIIATSATSVIGVIFATIIALIIVGFTGLTNLVTFGFITSAVIVALIISLRLRR